MTRSCRTSGPDHDVPMAPYSWLHSRAGRASQQLFSGTTATRNSFPLGWEGGDRSATV